MAIIKSIVTRPGAPGADGGGLASVSADPSPTLGGDLALGGHAIPGVTDALPGTPGPDDHAVVIDSSGDPVWAPRADGRSRVLLYDDFALHANGSPSGRTSAVGGITWATSGTEPPTVTSGALNSTGSGYLIAELTDTPEEIEGEFSFSSMTGSATLSLFRSDVASFGSMVHFEFDAEGGMVTVRANGGSFDGVNAPVWPRIPLDGTRVRIRMSVADSMLTVFGPRGTVFAAFDPRIGETLGSACDAVYWQAGDDCLLHTVAVYGSATSGVTTRADRGVAAARSTPDATHVVAAPWESWQVQIGPNNDGNPSIQFGAFDGVRLPLLDDVDISDTSIQLGVPLHNYSGQSAVIGYGTNAETVTLGSTSGSTSPYTVGISAATKAHSAGDAVLASPPGWLKAELIFNLGTGLFTLPANTTTGGLFELGTSRDTGITRGAAGVVRAANPGGGIVLLATGYGATGSRPSASTVGAGAMYFDTTLNKPIWSDGTNWRDATGTTV